MYLVLFTGKVNCAVSTQNCSTLAVTGSFVCFFLNKINLNKFTPIILDFKIPRFLAFCHFWFL